MLNKTLKTKIKEVLKVKRDGAFRTFCFLGLQFKVYSKKFAIMEIREDLENIKNMLDSNTLYQDISEQFQIIEQHLEEQQRIFNAGFEIQENNIARYVAEYSKQQSQSFEERNKIIYNEILNINNHINNQTRKLFDRSEILQRHIDSLQPNSFLHLSAYTIVNAGDNILVTALRDVIEKVTESTVTWVTKNVRNKLDDETVMLANNTNGIIIGGGGLFLKDTNPNNISGWQWPCSVNELDKIKVPVYYLGIGYNRFRGQDDFEPVFYENINKIVSQAAFFGMRNTGSVRAIQKYLKNELKEKVVFQPCATTILSKLYTIPVIQEEPPFIAVNCAFDRSVMRYGEYKDEKLQAISRVLKKLSKQYKVKYYIHMKSDEEMFPYLDEQNVTYERVYLNMQLDTDDFLRLYASPALVWAMRGHAQLIPFGCGTPTLSIITHDKLQWFLEDIGHTEWGIDILENNFEKELYEHSIFMLENQLKIKKEIEIEKEKLWEVTVRNLRSCNLLSHTSHQVST